MKIEIRTNDNVAIYDLSELAARYSNIITIGRKSDEVWNAIAIDDATLDSFQCHIIASGSSPRLHHGQERTECPKGLRSDKLIPCNGCMGRCVNVTAGRPKYYLRTPDIHTLVNNEPVAQYGTYLKPGDVITAGNTTMTITE